ncbi:SNF2-related protein [Dietzia sp. SL131]|uniref:SNF2-related protein n=1 Tax=Dietzia sp. SL131 TaxID=2995149 RepID=UPI002279F562|nr:SNF2-related protein [Dietzia sp. SL131]MCY1655736.1 SNF2-related protein [Dietzia sp. SL131]
MQPAQESPLGEFYVPEQIRPGAAVPDSPVEDTFRAIVIRPRYTPDDRPLTTFYVPMLSRSLSYDRAVGYWSAAELQFAAQGTAHFLANGGRMRLIVGAQLTRSDVDAALAGTPLDEVLAARMLADPDLEGARIVEDSHLSVLAWMVANDRLEIRVGVPCEGDKLLTHAESGRYFHTKYGVFTDRYGNKVAFTGSNNASVRAWVSNHETFDVFPSWHTEVWEWNGRAASEDFEKHWTAHPDAGWAVVPLPRAVREKLIEHAPDAPPLPDGEHQHEKHLDSEDAAIDPPATLPGDEEAWAQLVDLGTQPTQSPYTGVGTAQVEPLPHQANLIDRVVSTYPRGYLFADEVGLGKTVEAGLVLRELFLSHRARSALLLVPASVIRQWQEELHEKMNLDVPRFDKGGFVDRRDQPIPVPTGANPWSAFPIVLASSHLARRRDRRRDLLAAGPWDVVLVDEAHHARRRGAKPTDTPNSLLGLLIEMREKQMWKALYLASATPMQMNPHEAWDLISLLGLSGRWADSVDNFLKYYEHLRASPKHRNWRLLCAMLTDYFADPDADRDARLESQIGDDLGWVDSYAVTAMAENPPSAEARSQMPNEISEWMDKWLRRHTPMRDRVFRNTRSTLREYQNAGIIGDDVTIPHRHVSDVFIHLAPAERRLYDRIEEYIRRHYNAYKSDQSGQALGFIMTVYRRRLTSSFEAIKKSLTRRLIVLEEGRSLADLLAEDDKSDIENALFEPETFDASSSLLQDELHELRLFLGDLDKITGEDTKATRLVTDVNESLLTYDSVVVFTQYTDTMDYVRERLIAAGITKIGCYSGRGGQIYQPDTGTWREVTKAQIKEQFRKRHLTVLIGTDSMSEGLNLQTSGRLINYDMPWNLMRVEQRIGRVDRIGASYEQIQVTNYFYANTVEQRVYEGIAEDYGDFTDIVGDSAPVLGSLEKAIEQLALGEASDKAIDDQLGALKGEVKQLTGRAVQATDFGAAPTSADEVVLPPVLRGDLGLADLEQVLIRNPLTAQRLALVEGTPGVYQLTAPSQPAAHSFANSAGTKSAADYRRPPTDSAPQLVTFIREVSDHSADEVTLLTYGTPEFEALLPKRGSDRPPNRFGETPRGQHSH